MCRALGSSRTRGKGALRQGFLVSRVVFHMVAELPGAATAKAMSRPEQEETGEVFEEANGGQLEASELMAGGPLPMASVAGGPVPFSQLFVPGGGATNNTFCWRVAASDAFSTGRRSYAEQQSCLWCFDESWRICVSYESCVR